MSCDYGVWYPNRHLSNTEAGALYAELCEGRTSGVAAHSAVGAFYSELTSMHPEIDDVPEDKVDDHDFSPWSIAFERSNAHILMSCVWSKADYVGALLRRLARKHGLALYDPQKERVIYPDKPARAPWWKFWATSHPARSLHSVMRYRAFYQLQREGRVVDADDAEAMSVADIYTGIFRNMSEDGDYFGMIDSGEETLQLMYDRPSGRYWCEIPVPAEKGSYGKSLSFDQARDLLNALPSSFSRETIPGLQFKPWGKK
jgi:hypothetical protein